MRRPGWRVSLDYTSHGFDVGDALGGENRCFDLWPADLAIRRLRLIGWLCGLTGASGSTTGPRSIVDGGGAADARAVSVIDG